MQRIGKHILKWIGWTLLIGLILFSSAGLIVYLKGESYVNEKITKLVKENSNGLYQLNFDKVELTIKPISITFSNISLQTNKVVLTEILKKAPDKTFYSFQSPELKITAINVFELYKNQNFYCRKISITQPEFEISGETVLESNSEKNMNKLFKEIRPLFQKRIKKVIIDEIDFVDANYTLYHSVKNVSQISNAQKVSVAVKNFRTDSALIYSNIRFFESDDIIIHMYQFENNLSDSIHILKIDTLEYSLKSTDIFANGFHLTHKQKNKNKNLYDVLVPRLHLKSKNLSSFSISDSLEVQFLEFENAQIQFYQKETPQKLKVELINQFNLYSLVENQFSEIKIDSFILTNANLKIFQQPDSLNYQQYFKELTITLDRFELDSTSAKNKSKLFHADDISMTVNGYHLKLQDNEHEMSADSMFVSTFSNSLGIKGIRISPTVTEENKNHTSVNVSCSGLRINDVNLKTIYHTRTIPTRYITVDSPEILLQYHSEIERKSKVRETSLLFELISAYLKGVYSEVVEVENGSLSIQTFNNDKLQGYFETNFNFNLSGFALDSASIEQTDKFFHANNFDLEFFDYQMKLTDNLHKINADRVSIQSFDRKLEIENLSLKPIVQNADIITMQRFNRSELYNISVPKITLWGINLRDAFFYNKLTISTFKVSKPEIYFENFSTLRQIKAKKEYGEFFQLVFNYIYDFNIKEISIPDGKFTWINHTKKGKTTSFDNDFSAQLYNFRLNEDELKKERLLFSDNFDISVKDQIFQLSDSVHVLRAGEINVSTGKSSVEIKNALLYPLINSKKHDELPTTFQVSIPEIHLSNFDYLKAYYSKEIQLNTLEINTPVFEIYTQPGASKSLNLNKFQFPLPAFIKSLQLKKLKINNAEVINYTINGLKQNAQSTFKINLTLPNVSLKNNAEHQAQLTTQNLIANIYDFRTPLGRNHELKIAQLDFNRSKKDIKISQLEVNPFTTSITDNRFSISVPEIYLSDFDIEDALKNSYFRFDKIRFVDPSIAIEVVDSVKGDKLEFAKNLDLFPFVESYVNRIEVQEVQLQKVDLNFNWFEKELINKEFNLNFKEIVIGENIKSQNLLNSKEFELSTTFLKAKSKDGFYEFTADSLIYNSAKHSTFLKNIEIKPLLSNTEFHQKINFQTDYVSAKIQFIELRNIDETQWIKNKILDAEMFVVGESTLNIFRNKRLLFNENQRPPWPQDLLRDIKQSFVFDSVILMPSSIKYNELLDLTDEPGFVEFTNLSFNTGRISNIPEAIAQNPSLKIDASANLYNRGLLSVNFIFNLKPGVYNHSVVGHLSPMSLLPFNNMIDKSVPISIQSGQINRFDFKIDFNENNSKGLLYLGYDDFKIAVLEMNLKGTKKSKFATFWANNMILNSKSPKGEILLPTTISYEKDIQRSIINYWWKSIYTGAKETIGIKPKE